MGPQAVGGDVDVGLLPKGHPDARAPCVGEMHTVDRLQVAGHGLSLGARECPSPITGRCVTAIEQLIDMLLGLRFTLDSSVSQGSRVTPLARL
jgi:hypothetical protein